MNDVMYSARSLKKTTSIWPKQMYVLNRRDGGQDGPLRMAQEPDISAAINIMGSASFARFISKTRETKHSKPTLAANMLFLPKPNHYASREVTGRLIFFFQGERRRVSPQYDLMKKEAFRRSPTGRCRCWQ